MSARARRAGFLLLASLAATAAVAQASGSTTAAKPASTPSGPEAASAAAAPFVFAYDYHKGDKFRVLSEVSEDIYVNHVLAKRAEIMNRIAFEVADSAPDGGSASLAGTFVTSERAKGETNYVVTGQYDSRFVQSRLGVYTIGDEYFMPVVRDVPTFPDHALSPGDTWTAPGEERHDFREGFGIPKPYAIPFVANYRYEGPETKGGRSVQRLSASYTIYYEPPVPPEYNEVYPV